MTVDVRPMPNAMSLSQEQVEKVAILAAQKAITDLFEIFGIDMSTKEGRREFAQDMAFVRIARIGSGRFRTATIAGLGGSIVTGVSYLLYKGLVAIGFVVR